MRAHGLLPHDAGEGPRLGGARVGEHLGGEPEYPHVVPRLNLRGPEERSGGEISVGLRVRGFNVPQSFQ